MISRILYVIPELWLEWTEDEIRMAQEDDESDRDRICALFERAVKDYVCKCGKHNDYFHHIAT